MRGWFHFFHNDLTSWWTFFRNSSSWLARTLTCLVKPVTTWINYSSLRSGTIWGPVSKTPSCSILSSLSSFLSGFSAFSNFSSFSFFQYKNVFGMLRFALASMKQFCNCFTDGRPALFHNTTKVVFNSQWETNWKNNYLNRFVFKYLHSNKKEAERKGKAQQFM